MNESKRDKIAARAYRIWEEEGRPEGKEAEHWRRAEQEVARQESAPQMGGDTPPDAPLDTRPPPPLKAAPPEGDRPEGDRPQDGGDMKSAKPTSPRPKRRSGRTRTSRTPPQED